MKHESLSRLDYLALVLLAAAGLLLVRMAPTRLYVSGDSQEALVTAQAILQHNTIRLDAYYPEGWPATVTQEGGHLYYYFPLGTSLLSVPFVGVQLWRGKDMLVEADNFALQRHLAALMVAFSLILVYLICRRFVGRGLSLLFTVVFVFGSSIVSTMGTALWSVDLAFLFMLLAILVLINPPGGNLQRVAPYLLGAALFMAYLSRPTAAAMILPVFVYVLLVKRAWFLGMAATFAVLATGLVLFSQSEFGQVLPSYYLPSRLKDNEAFWTALYANLASPGRGILVYSPFLLAVLAGLALVLRQIWRQPLLWLALAWIVLHLVSVSQLWRWWGGWSFGSRFMAETLLAWLLVTLLVWPAAQQALSRPVYAGLTGSFAALGVVAILINTVQGLYNPATVDWNGWHRPLAAGESPQIALMLDWRYPQFLASPRQLAARNVKYWLAESPQPLALGAGIVAQSTAVLFEGWYEPETSDGDTWRWSSGDSAKILFTADPALADSARPLTLRVVASYFQPQRVTVLLNGEPIGVIDDRGDGATAQHSVPFDSSLLVFSGERPFNTLEFHIPNAVSPATIVPGNPDERVIGMALREVWLLAVDTPSRG